jgi:hypothetical protein
MIFFVFQSPFIFDIWRIKVTNLAGTKRTENLLGFLEVGGYSQ